MSEQWGILKILTSFLCLVHFWLLLIILLSEYLVNQDGMEIFSRDFLTLAAVSQLLSLSSLFPHLPSLPPLPVSISILYSSFINGDIFTAELTSIKHFIPISNFSGVASTCDAVSFLSGFDNLFSNVKAILTSEYK